MAIQLKRGLRVSRKASTEVLKSGQPFYEKDTNKLYVGDGESELSTLKYINQEFEEQHNNVQNGSGDQSAVVGDMASASGSYSFASGCYTTASGDYSHAEGYQTTASGDASHAGGVGTTAYNCQTVVGRYNAYEGAPSVIYPTDNVNGYLFIVGNGTSDDARSTAFKVANDGRAKVQSAPIEEDDVMRLVDTNLVTGSGVGSVQSKESGCLTSGDYSLSVGENLHNAGYHSAMLLGSEIDELKIYDGDTEDTKADKRYYLDKVAAAGGEVTGTGDSRVTTANVNIGDSSFVLGGVVYNAGLSSTIFGSNNIIGENNFDITDESTGKREVKVCANNFIAGGTFNYIDRAQMCSTLGYKNTIDNSYGCTLIGQHLKAEGRYSKTVVGVYNKDNEGTLFEVGNGSSEGTRQNVFEVTVDGRAKASNGICIGANLDNSAPYSAMFGSELTNSEAAKYAMMFGRGGEYTASSSNVDQNYFLDNLASADSSLVTENSDGTRTATVGINKGKYSLLGGYAMYNATQNSAAFGSQNVIGANTNTDGGTSANNFISGSFNYIDKAANSSILGYKNRIYDSSMCNQFGRNLKTERGYFKTVVGCYNEDGGSNTRFEVGVGDSDGDRRNGFAVFKDGRAKVYGAPTESDDVVRLTELSNAKRDLYTDIEQTQNSLNTVLKGAIFSAVAGVGSTLTKASSNNLTLTTVQAMVGHCNAPYGGYYSVVFTVPDGWSGQLSSPYGSTQFIESGDEVYIVGDFTITSYCVGSSVDNDFGFLITTLDGVYSISGKENANLYLRIYGYESLFYKITQIIP